MQIKSTNDVASNGVKILGYGHAGAGKTRLLATLPNPFVISAEAGLLSIQGSGVDFVEVSSMTDIQEAYEFLTESEEGKKYDSVGVDSITEIAEFVLASELKDCKDPRQAYGQANQKVTTLIKLFRDLSGKHVYFTSKLDDSEGRHRPSMPGKSLTKDLPYLFDEVFAIRKEKDAEGNDVEIIQTCSETSWEAKDRSGKLEKWTSYDVGLGGIIERIVG